MTAVSACFACSHVQMVEVRVDRDVEVPEQVRGLGKCPKCLAQPKVLAIPGLQPTVDGRLTLDSIFLMPMD